MTSGAVAAAIGHQTGSGSTLLLFLTPLVPRTHAMSALAEALSVSHAKPTLEFGNNLIMGSHV
jgi:hypothetical protein